MGTRFCFILPGEFMIWRLVHLIISAFSGIADPNSFGQQFEVPKEKTHKINYSQNKLSFLNFMNR